MLFSRMVKIMNCPCTSVRRIIAICIGQLNSREKGQIPRLEYAEEQLKPSAGVDGLTPNEIILWIISHMLFLKSALAGWTHHLKVLVIVDIYARVSYHETTILAEKVQNISRHYQPFFKRNASVVIRSSHRYG